MLKTLLKSKTIYFILFFLLFPHAVFAYKSFDKILIKTQEDLLQKSLQFLKQDNFSALKKAIAPYQIKEIQDNNGNSLLHLAAAQNMSSKIIGDLLEYIPVNTPSKSGLTALHIAVSKKYKGLVTFLLDNNANINQKDNIGRTALHFATSGNNAQMVQYLLNKKADIDAKDSNGLTALTIAVNGSNLPLASLLIKRGANVNARTSLRKTPLHFATQNTDIPMMKLLIANGADVNARDKILTNPKAPLDVIENAKTKITLTQNQSQAEKILLDSGAKNAVPYYEGTLAVSVKYLYGEPTYDFLDDIDVPLAVQYVGPEITYYVKPDLSLFWGYYFGFPVEKKFSNDYYFVRMPGALLGLQEIFSLFSTHYKDEFHGPSRGLFFALLGLSALLPEGISWNYYLPSSQQFNFAIDINWANVHMIIPKNSATKEPFNIDINGEVGARINFLLGESTLVDFGLNIGMSYTKIDFIWDTGVSFGWLF